MTFEYRCPECGARVSSGWADPVCPVPGCGAVLDVLAAPEPSQADVDRVIQEAEKIVARKAKWYR